MEVAVDDRPSAALAGVGVLATFVTFGFGRFAYGALLPSMRDDLGLSYTAAGALATANLIAYLVGAQLARVLLRTRAPAGLIIVAMAGSAAAFAALSIVGGIGVALLLMTALGLLSATAWISVVQLTREAIPGPRQGRFLGVTGLGAAWGIPIVAALIGVVAAVGGDDAWRWSWVTMAVLAASAAVVARPVLLAAPSPRGAPRALPPRLRRDLQDPATVRLLVSYLLYGAWFSIFATFVVSYLQDGGLTEGSSTAVWSVLGIAAGLGTLVGGRLADRHDARRVAVVGLVIAATAAAVLAGASSWARLVVTAAVGFPLVGTGTALTLHASQLFSDISASTRIVSVATTTNALGQALGPVVAGPTIDATGSYTVAFVLAAVFGGAAALTLGRPHRPLDERSRDLQNL